MPEVIHSWRKALRILHRPYVFLVDNSYSMAGIHTHKPKVPKGMGIWPETLMRN